jgi:hypothetical protein
MLLLAPIIWLYYFEQGCAAYAAQPQLTLTASLTRKLSCYTNSSMVVLTHHQFRGADSPRNIFTTLPLSEGCWAILGQQITPLSVMAAQAFTTSSMFCQAIISSFVALPWPFWSLIHVQPRYHFKHHGCQMAFWDQAPAAGGPWLFCRSSL